tara:strand:- start:15388 stop:19893 length:4506 start_codon:yes stop_codon:yes gene_type:complete
MANIQKNFIQGKMNKSVDERLIPNGQYIDALNVRLGSTEASEIGSVENSKGNEKITTLEFNGTDLSADARCIGAYEDGSNETIYFFVHDPSYTVGTTGKLDLIVSFDEQNDITTYHVVSMKEGASGTNTTLNFDPSFLIHSINKIEDLLFFTDNTNQPRFINVTRNYQQPFNNIDVITAESLLVIKKPPTTSPAFSLFTSPQENNYLENKLICFAYRFEYQDDDYSATSQWSKPAFLPKTFSIGVDDKLNNGMENARNGVSVTYNTGGSLVKSIEVLFKESNKNTINVIDKFNKNENGFVDNQDVTIEFDSNQIFTILNSDQLGRLYDAVPLKAKTQTLMGNRIIYGNYVEGYDLTSSNGDPINLDYTVSLVNKAIGLTDITTTLSDGTYTIDTSAGTQTITDSNITLDLSGFDLVVGAQISFDIRLVHFSFTGSPVPSETVESLDLSFTFTLPTNYNSVTSLVNSTEFQSALGPGETILTACSAGTTWTDEYNCLMPNVLGSLVAYTSGIGPVTFPAVGSITGIASGNNIIIQLPAMQWVDNTGTPTVTITEYFRIQTSEATFQKISDTESLHSNRDYAIGIVYMDDFGRSSTALLASDASIHVPCSNSDFKNSINVEIPTNMLPPSWAKRYKFVIKPSQTTYETIYSNLFINDPTQIGYWFLLEGENIEKISEGQRLQVKADTSGAVNNCAVATVLEKVSQPSGFITFDSSFSSTAIDAPAGTYMRVVPNDFNVVLDEGAVQFQENEECTDTSGNSPMAACRVNRGDTSSGQPTGYLYSDYTIPEGSRIKLYFRFRRLGTGDGNNKCERRIYELDLDLVSSANYDNFQEWFDGDNIELRLDDGLWTGGSTSAGNPPTNTLLSNRTSAFDNRPTESDAGMTANSITTNFFRLVRSSTDNGLWLCATGTESCSGVGQRTRRRSCSKIEVTVFRSEDTIVFESEPQDALPDVFYEGDQSYPIISATGLHGGGTAAQILAGNRTQTSATSGKIQTTLFNCYSFGNGVESFKILDSVGGQELQIGNRVTTTANQEYKQAHRFADLTYSGRYSDFSNINKLNEFNFSLANYKILEDSFGPVAKLFGRETDVLVLQEDKISYVLAGKNLLSDSTGGGVVASVPEVLGTQIARKEVYGISNNPESFVCYGADKYFTDSKRGAVLQMRGTSMQNEQLSVISESGMRGFFRDLFINSFDTQKLGGYDPYMNEYVLSNNCIALPTSPQIENCGISLNYGLINASNPQSFIVRLGQPLGQVAITYTAPLLDFNTTFSIKVNYNGVEVANTGDVTTGGTLTFQKNDLTVNEATITISAAGGYIANLGLSVSCPQADQITVKTIVITSDLSSGSLIHTYYQYTDASFSSMQTSQFVQFLSGTNPVVSSFVEVTGGQGINTIPTDSSTVQLGSLFKPSDDYVFDTTSDRFGYLRSATNYNNNTSDINNLITDITNSSGWLTTNTSLAPQKYFGEFTMPNNDLDFLYLVYDLTSTFRLQMCYSPTGEQDACCGCS